MSKKETAISALAAMETSPAMADRVARAISTTRTQPSAPPDGCYRCHQEIYISFFFDGFGQELKSGGSISNVGRLYNAHRATKKESGIYSLYYEGMGRRLSSETVGVAGVLAAKTVEKAKEVLADKFKDGINDARKEAVNEAKSDAIASLKSGSKDGIRSAFLNGFEKFKDGVKPSSIAGAMGKALKDPMLFVASGISVVSDSVPQIRDSEIAAGYLGTGFDARIEKASKDFKEIIEQARNSDLRPIKTIRVSMFGYDRGAVIARKFANELIEKICKKDGEKIKYGISEVQFDFMGLFDSVSSAYGDSFFATVGTTALTWAAGAVTSETGGWGAALVQGGSKVISMLVGLAKRSLGEFDTPGEFRKIVHHVAATELRFYKPLDSSRNSKETGNLTEVVYPGSQSDVGGGFAEGDDGKSAELAKVSARNMLDQAWACGVPIYRVDELKEKGLRIAAREFDFKKTIQVNGKTLTVNDLFGACAALLPTGRGTLEHHLLAHQKLFISWARSVHERTGTYSNGSNLFINMIDADVYNEIFVGTPTPGYDVRASYYSEAEKGAVRPDLTGVKHSVDDIRDPTIRELATAWVKPVPLSPEVTAFFDHFVHNTITRANNVSLGDGVFLQLRTIEDKSRKYQTIDKVKDAASKAAKKILPNPDQIREEKLKKLQDAATWTQGSQRYPDPLGLGSPISDISPLNNLAKE
ncbi:DUF2235 domain-containing protein [Burkholderia vietnamiensis]|uniref:phospholipase effector Tle1 domain-containing protein n=1 Tax=Burkholderia vietnamiensis TaxID=60552 RepID=UPI0015947552|nr:DUF2235 domain-containing protein [Burkholderia vietnamiensis]MBR8231025.1 DUF2235 domain-containing protein [Burkholderia vietnamiensis]MCA7945869.1 DUF2235 domain-containing protein [Burkholderia vietnamiensis]HDR8973201.1 DUF2235 domain-containing protein [Burkholderia vietnamiensis]HDR9146874.1 DUF2235 domain-containing protein [Burkholderia vietnamiensis]HDR9219665.1 DUF2235 domain-containing protein [Burkholderia vietnamiensis]